MSPDITSGKNASNVTAAQTHNVVYLYVSNIVSLSCRDIRK